MTTPIGLDAIEARAKAATEGPWKPCHHWRVDHCGCGKHPGYIWAGDEERVVAQMGCQEDAAGQAYPEPGEDECRANARFIAHAREDVPALVAEVRRLREALADAIGIAVRYGGIGGDHHKAWVIDQMVRALAGNEYERIVRDAKAGDDGPETHEWDEGIAP